MTIQSPYSATTQKAMATFKQYASSLDGWTFVNEKDGVKIYSKSDSTPHLLVRGEYVLSGTQYTMRQVDAVANSIGARKHWDDKVESANIKENYNLDETLMWSKLKAPWPISARDVAGVFLRETTDKEINSVIVSAQDGALPAVSGCVRANLILSGWRMTQVANGIAITSISQIDLAGSIPTAFLKSVHQQTPLCVQKVSKYIIDYGFPPYVESVSAKLKDEVFEHGKKEYVLTLDGTGDATIATSKKMYPSGCKVKITGKATHKVVGNSIVITGASGVTTVKLSKA